MLSVAVELLEVSLELLLLSWLATNSIDEVHNLITHDELLFCFKPITNPTINPTRHNITASAINANRFHPPRFAIIGLFRRLARCFSLSVVVSLPLVSDIDTYDNGDAIGFLAHGGRAGGLRGFTLGSAWMVKSPPSSEIAGNVPFESISRGCECIVKMKAIFTYAPYAGYYRAGSLDDRHCWSRPDSHTRNTGKVLRAEMEDSLSPRCRLEWG